MTETTETVTRTPDKCWRCWKPRTPGQWGCVADSPHSLVCVDEAACTARIYDGTYIPRTPGRRKRVKA